MVHDPGKVEGMVENLNFVLGARRTGDQQEPGGKAIGVGGKGMEAGCIVMMKREWAEAKVGQCALDEQGRAFCVEFKGAVKPTDAPLSKVMVLGLYGYNSPPTVRHKAETLLSVCRDAIEKYTHRYPSALVITLGDLNAAEDSFLDTDKGMKGVAKDAWFISAVQGLGVADVFRWWHPLVSAITHKGTGGLEDNAGRRLDCIMASEEIAIHESTAIWIRQLDGLSTDHRMVVIDCAVNTARVAGVPIPIWPTHTTTRYIFKSRVRTIMRSPYERPHPAACYLTSNDRACANAELSSRAFVRT